MNWIDEKLAERKYATKPVKPRMTGSTAEDARKYAFDLEEHEFQMDTYRELRVEYAAHNFAIEQEVEARIKEETGFNSIPEQYQAKVWSYAWREGHSSGYSEVSNILRDLISIF